MVWERFEGYVIKEAAETRTGESVHNTPCVPPASEFRIIVFAMSQGPLELPTLAILARPWRLWRRQKNRWVVDIFVTEKFSGPRILYLKPAGRKADCRNHKLPAVLLVSCYVLLAVDLMCGAYRLAIVYINDMVVKNTN